MKQAQLEQQQQASKAYLEAVYEYHLKGLSLREISKVTGIPQATVYQWIQKVKKEKEQYVKEAKQLKESMEKPQ